jgi:hypothetical protein
MCTLTHLPRPDPSQPTWLCRLAFNRDELLSRGPEIAPQLRCTGERAALWPLDTVSGGTWLGVNDRGVAAFLLNANPPDPRHPHGTHSRGDLIPNALAADDVAGALARVHTALADGVYPWFRLVLVDGASACVVRHLPEGQDLQHPAPDEGWLLTSSSLGDQVVTPPRAELFATQVQALAAGPARLEAQRRFHAHRWPERGELSVNMQRPDAGTRSYCEIDLHADRVCLRYQPAPPPLSARPGEWVLPRVLD